MAGSRGSWASLIQALSLVTLRVAGVTGEQVDGAWWSAILKQRCDQTEGVPINYWVAEMRLASHTSAHCPEEGEQRWPWWLNSEELTRRQLQNANICKLHGCLVLFRVLNTCIVFSSQERWILILKFPDLQGSKAGICPVKVLFLLHVCKSHWNMHCYPAVDVLLLRWVIHPWGMRQSMASLEKELEEEEEEKGERIWYFSTQCPMAS